MREQVTLLLDSDIIAYKFAATAEEKFQWEDDEPPHYVVKPLDEVMPDVHNYIEELVKKLQADKAVVCLSCPTVDNFRLSIFPQYKMNRVGLRKPELLMPIKRAMAEAYETYERPGLEADDIMGILSTHPTLIPGKKIIVSEDKDMNTIPGWLFNPAKDVRVNRISEIDADYFHYYQTLVGDAVDNYKGLPGIGPVKADKILWGFGELSRGSSWAEVVDAYESKGLTEEDALVQARVARILRAEDYDFKKKEVRLWNPPARLAAVA